jgi:crotonobetaine/carnitine-CoA ligase
MDIDYLSGSPALLQNVFAGFAASDPTRTWCTFQGTTYTYGEIDASANRLAHALRDEISITRGDVVAVHMANCAEYFVAMFAIQRLGAVYLPCSTLFTEDELRYQFSNAEVRAVFTDATTLELALQCLPGEPCPVIVCGGESQAGVLTYSELVASRSALMPDEAHSVTENDLAMLLYTSGTTDRPKGVMFSQGNLTTAGLVWKRHLRWREDDIYLHYFPLYHANGGVAGVAPAISAGATLAMIPKFSASTFGQSLVENDATLVSVNSTHVNMIMRHPVTEFDRAHRARRMTLGMTLDTDVWRAFEERFDTRLVSGYGLTESIGSKVLGDPVGPRAIGAAGRVVRGYTLRIVNDEGGPVGVNEPGEALFKAHQRHGIAMGYFKDPEKTKETFGEWLHTGDIVRADEDGFVWFVSRKKDMIKRSGFNVAGAEVERVIREIPGVLDVVVVGTPDVIREEAIVAFVVAETPGAVQEDQVFEQCARMLADYKRPQFVEFLDALPVNFIGKVERNLLRELALKYRIDSTEWAPVDRHG